MMILTNYTILIMLKNLQPLLLNVKKNNHSTKMYALSGIKIIKNIKLYSLK